MICTECGFPLWSDEAKKLGAHPECLEDYPSPELTDLEDTLERALEDGDEMP